METLHALSHWIFTHLRKVSSMFSFSHIKTNWGLKWSNNLPIVSQQMSRETKSGKQVFKIPRSFQLQHTYSVIKIKPILPESLEILSLVENPAVCLCPLPRLHTISDGEEVWDSMYTHCIWVSKGWASGPVLLPWLMSENDSRNSCYCYPPWCLKWAPEKGTSQSSPLGMIC